MQQISGDLRLWSPDWEHKTTQKLYSFNNRVITTPIYNLRPSQINDMQERDRRLNILVALDVREESHTYLANSSITMTDVIKLIPNRDNKTVSGLVIDNFEINFQEYERLNQLIASNIINGVTLHLDV